jgi:hypothetical protein
MGYIVIFFGVIVFLILINHLMGLRQTDNNSDNSSSNRHSYKNAPSAKFAFMKLKGIDFNNVLESSSNLLNDVISDVNGNWYFSNEKMIMLMKSFTMNSANTALDDLLIFNNLDINDVKYNGEIKYWKGNGFNIEFPPENQGIRIIVITH